ncbi:MAG TPA: hypothetical protein VER11_08185 [Polyangiaceae bacterium]|nr:hypothetical protein [Polyangiaceae bacterium]
MKSISIFCAGLLLSVTVASSASASERHFGFGYESTVLNPGLAELQPWTTERAGRANYYNRLEARVGFQLGLTRNLQAALFWNISSTAEDVQVPGAALKSRLSTTDFQSLSAQLKYKFTDATADALGSALLLEGQAGPLLVGYEGRVILDKQLGSLLLALNLISTGYEQLELTSRFVGSFGASAGAGYFVTPNVVASLELRNENSLSKERAESLRYLSSVLYLGPAVSYASTRFWLTLAVQPQVVAFKGATDGYHLDLTRNEYVQARLLLGFPL